MNEVPVLGMANITGGGIPENLPRCFPKVSKMLITTLGSYQMFSRELCYQERYQRKRFLFNLG